MEGNKIYLLAELNGLARAHPRVLKTVRGVGLMIGIELASGIPAYSANGKAASLQFVHELHEAGVLTIPSGTNVARLLPPLNLRRTEAQEGLKVIQAIVSSLAS